ncbi:MAG TPA: SLBB domain-containing protein [Candidatus Marinimicrobia bacterium]|nr:SLBB domain-containing protein [Candidatus Neomarinimicrobiota bacterium]HRS51658.1 SLBB domain-containing protein [Candidatus Neomarinimicrobiota bacterium]HRU92192.1 SLBB domain-containing protein [Candidatus Neomarinimicrobiota bacterium]
MKRAFIILMIFILFHISFGQQSKTSQLQKSYKSYGKMFEQETEKEKTDLKERAKEISLPQEIIALDKAISPDEYIVGPGDIFGVDIIITENINLELFVTPTGDLLIPSIGKINVNGLILKDAIELCKKKINQVYPSAKVDVALLNLRTFKIQITGAVIKPGFYDVTAVTRLNEIIELAEGFDQFAKEFNIQITRNDGRIDTVNYFNYKLEGDLTHNPTFLEGDKIFVPFGDADKEAIVIRGAIYGSGYDVIEENESLGYYLRRQAQFIENADLENVTITRKEGDHRVVMTVYPQDFFSTPLKPGDAIDILSERGISVNGFVQSPGSFYFYPGYSYLDYINMAGGNTYEGDIDKVYIRHLDGSTEPGKSAALRRGDVIIVPRSSKSTIFGQLSILEIVTSVATVVLTFIAAMK